MTKLHEDYDNLKEQIEQKYQTFNTVWELGDAEIFPELVFCLCTPQSNAKAGWKATKNIMQMDPQILKMTDGAMAEKIAQILSDSGVRFKNKKSIYIVEAFRRFGGAKVSLKEFLTKLINKLGVVGVRDWLAQNVKGMGMKEASHFMRNIGFGDDICILDRHILRCLEEYAGMKQPKSLGTKEYRNIEIEMKKFAQEVDIPNFALDFVFWADKHKGELFK